MQILESLNVSYELVKMKLIITLLLFISCRAKRPATATNGSNNIASKKGRGAGGLQNQLVNRALEGLSGGGRGGIRGRGRGWGGCGRGSGRGRVYR